MGKKGLSVDQADYYETEAGKELYREREYKRLRRARGSKKKEDVEGEEDFIVKKPKFEDTMEIPACMDTMEMNLYKDTMEMKIYKEKISATQTESESYDENPTENIASK